MVQGVQEEQGVRLPPAIDISAGGPGDSRSGDPRRDGGDRGDRGPSRTPLRWGTAEEEEEAAISTLEEETAIAADGAEKEDRPAGRASEFSRRTCGAGAARQSTGARQNSLPPCPSLPQDRGARWVKPQQRPHKPPGSASCFTIFCHLQKT